MSGRISARSFPVFHTPRTGSMTFVAVVMGIIFFMLVSALLHFLSGEKDQVIQVIGRKQAETLALTGIDWADQALRVGRWYQKPFGEPNKTGEGRPTSGKYVFSPFGPDEGKVTVVCEDVASKDHPPLWNMQQLWLLHHINVYSLGEFKGFKCLVSGRFIMSPEPALNDWTTDGAIFSDRAAQDGVTVVPFPKTSSRYSLKEVKTDVGKNVDMNTVLAIIEDESGNSMELLAPCAGKMKDVSAVLGGRYEGGVAYGTIQKQPGVDTPGYSMRTLKRMVRVTRIGSSPWKDLDIESFSDRRILSNYISMLSPAYVMNFSAHEDLMSAIEANKDNPLGPKISPEEFLKRFPANVTWNSRNRAENEFLREFLQNFATTNVKDLPGALSQTEWKLDHENRDFPPNLQAGLRGYGLDPYQLAFTAPKKNDLFQTPVNFNGGKPDVISRLLPNSMNLDTDQFIGKLSELPDSSRWAVFSDSPDVKSSSRTEDDRCIQIAVAGKGTVTVTKSPKDFLFQDKAGKFITRAKDVLEFARKYYSDKNAVIPHEDTRKAEFLDWPYPEPPGPPPSGGGGDWVWIPGSPGVPPGPPNITTVPVKTVTVPFPSGGNRDFNDNSGGIDGGKDLKTVDGVAPTSDSRGGSNPAGSPEQGGAMNGNPAGAPESAGDSGGVPAGIPVKDGQIAGNPGGSPESKNSLFPKTQAPIKVPTEEKTTVTPGTPGKEPAKGQWIKVTNTCGGSPTGGEQGGNKSESEGGGSGSTQGQGSNGKTPDPGSSMDGNGLDSNGGPGKSEGNGLDSNGGPGQANGNGLDSNGGPGNADGYGNQADGGPGNADGQGRDTTGSNGKGTGYGKDSSGPGGSQGTGYSAKGTPGKADIEEKAKDKGLIHCPGCGGYHYPPPAPSGGGGTSGGGGGGGGGGSGGC